MAGNITADNSGNILVEFDYNNIIVVDPNKTFDPTTKKISERIVDHENLVMYANLEAEVVPRTKLAIGGSPEDRVRIISVAKINFLKPTQETYLGTGYYDELTGENTTKFKGQNQMLQRTASNTDGSKGYVINQPTDLNNIIDNGLLGITQINITTNSSFVPSVKIELEDVQGKALFQLGNNSPYSAFFNLPYPAFYLTLKGYYGQAIRYQLNLEKFNCRFNSFSGNYQVSLEFRGYKFNILNEIAMGHLLATPHMYSTRFDITTTPIQSQQTQKSALSSGGNNIVQNQGLATSNSQGVAQIVAKKGYQKIKEVYSEYKAKKLIPPNFPEYTLQQLMNLLDTFEKRITASFPKTDVEPLTNIRTYKGFLKQYFDAVRGANSSWFNRFMNPLVIILKDQRRVYTFKDDLDLKQKDDAVQELKKIIVEYTKVLVGNPTLGQKGAAPIPVPITFDTINLTPPPNIDQIDWPATTTQQTGVVVPNESQILQTQNKYKGLILPTLKLTPEKQLELQRPNFFIFEGDGRFDKQIAQIETTANKKLSEYETKISNELLRKIEDTATGIGFRPSVRNIIAVIMASAEAFIRLMDEVHTKAWSVKYDPVRKNAILENPGSAPSSDTVDNVKITTQAIEQNTNLSYSQIPVYPWPQFFVETPEDKKGRFQLKYIADPTIVDLTQGYLYDKWPEVEFVEEYMIGLTQKFDPPAEPPPLDNQQNTNIININAIEFPNTGVAYANKEEIKFYYEIWERQFLTSRYSNLVRANQNQINDLIKLNTETEVNNIVTSLGVSSPYITMKLKNYDLTAQNYPTFLQTISNNGTGRAWQDYIKDFFVTPYIKGITESSFGILNALDIGKIPQTEAKSDALRALLVNASNEPLIIDTLPFTNPQWSLANLANGSQTQGTAVYNTNKTLTIFEPRKVIANFTNTYNFTENRPVTNFSYLDSTNPMSAVSALTTNQENISTFYNLRKPKNFTATEGFSFYTSPKNDFPIKTTTSILNTPYFVNAIMNGVANNKQNNPYPYVQAAYLFLNSLPLATLREKYKKLNGVETEDLDYIASCFKKFGAIHKLPYAWILKLGSNWHRYKTYTQTGNDILTTCWKNFDYTKNYSPILTSNTQTYTFKYPSPAGLVDTKITLQTETTSGVTMSVGFYPKVINDYNYFFTGFELYSGYTDTEIQTSVNNGMKIYQFASSNINAKQGDKDLTLNTWSVLLPQAQGTSVNNCDPTNNSRGTEYFVVPSFGSPVNQVRYTCLTDLSSTPKTVVNVSSNSSVYNGTVRGLWSAPNYGYFDNDKISFPTYDSYVNLIDPAISEQSPMSLLATSGYSKIEEVFSVFEKRVLDLFEDEFLKFCKPISNADFTSSNQFLTSTVNIDANLRNFQSLYKSLMTVQPQTQGSTDTSYFQSVLDSQYVIFTNGIKAFMQYDIIFKFGNPSNYERRIWDSYLSHLSSPVVDAPITFEPYVQNSLPTAGGGITLQQSKINNPQAWRALELSVGFSTIPNVRYSNTGSYITDFFVDNNIKFTEENINLLSPIIKMWATSKLSNPSITRTQFQNNISTFFQKETDLQNNFLNEVLTGIRRALPNQQQLPGGVIKSVIQGEQSKVENYEVFKALNDKWIAGGDFTTKTLFEDMLFLDRASRNIGDTILLDIFDLKYMFGVGGKEGEYSLNQAMSVFTFISGILIKNNFTVMNLPAYVNFYNAQDVNGTVTSNTEGSLEFADNLWGTFLNVDYRNSGPKMVCFYVGKPSQYLDLPKGNFRFRDDGFEMSRASENPLLENVKGKTDYAVSNKCVGFNVDIGTRNQNIFYSFSVSQDSGVATSESINTQLNMVNQATGRNTATQNVSLYNLYKNRSYKCNVVALGNALIQPTMYFNLRHVPMFNGPYMITEVSHQIQPGTFQTSFTGVRQGIYDLPSIDNFLQSINQNLLTKLEELLKIEKDKTTISGTTTTQNANEVVQRSDNTRDASNSCTNNVDTAVYQNYSVTEANLTGVTPEQLAAAIKAEVVNSGLDLPTQEILSATIFALCYVKSFVPSGNTGVGKFNGYNNNFANISLYNNFTPTSNQYFTNTFCCISVKASTAVIRSEPLVTFKDLNTFVKFMVDRVKPRIGQIQKIGITKFYVCYWPKAGVTESYYDSNKAEFSTVEKTVSESIDIAVNAKLLPEKYAKDYKEQNTTTPQTSRVPGSTPTPTPVPPNPGQSCPPPTLDSFSPLSGNTGTIVQLNGKNFNCVTGVTINNTVVPKTGITIFNNTTMRVNVPTIGTGVRSVGSIILQSSYGNSVALTQSQFTFDPALPASSTSSPGGYQNPTPPSPSPTVPLPDPAANNNPQQTTGTVPLVVTQKTTAQVGGNDVLVVSVNPNAGSWTIYNQPTIQCSLYSYKTENNRTIEVLEDDDIKYTLTNTPSITYVPTGGQTFQINRQNLLDELKPDIDDYPNQRLKIDIQIKLKALPVASSAQTYFGYYNYTLIVPGPTSPTQLTTEPPGRLLLVNNTNDVALPNYSGGNIYNIKKPGGGYITFKFDCPNLAQKNEPVVRIGGSSSKATITVENNGGTKYTNVITVNALGALTLQIGYTSQNYQLNGSLLAASATADFTL